MIENLNLENRSMLKKTSKEVEAGTDLSEEIALMFEIMDKNNGIGLAANQIGLDARVIVIDVGDVCQAIINPLLSNLKMPGTRSIEGCLSFPGKKSTMYRYRKVTVDGFDENWDPVHLSVRGLIAFCMQHEIDHLDGKTI